MKTKSNTGNKVGISLINLLKIDEYCSAEVADISSNANILLTMHSNSPLHEYPIKYNKKLLLHTS